MRRLLAFVLLLASCPAARAQGSDFPDLDWFAPVSRAAAQFEAGRSDQGEVAVALWAWRLESGAPARERIERVLELHWHLAAERDDAHALLVALLDPPPLPVIGDDAPLASLLVAPPGESILERAVRSARFTRGLDRVPLSAALDALDPHHPWVAVLDPRHPWVEDVRARLVRIEPVLRGLACMFDRLALPVDPRVGERVSLTWLDVDAWTDDLWSHDGKASGGWILARTATDLTILDDRLGRVSVPVARTRPSDVDEELRRWSARDERACSAYSGWTDLDERNSGSSALRAWWALRRGRVWTAARIAEGATCVSDCDEVDTLARVATELAGAVEEATRRDLAEHRPRAEGVVALRRAIAMLDLAWDVDDVREPLVILADRLEEQDLALSRAPPRPSGAAWQRLSPSERVPHLIRALADCDGDPTASELVALGELAIPALIEAMTDRAPTRCPLTVGECALEVLGAIVDVSGPAGEFLPLRFKEEESDALERQARARDWWAGVVARGGLVTDQMARLLQVDRVTAWTSTSPTRQELVCWLLHHGQGREVDLIRAAVMAAPDEDVRADWLRALGQAPHDGFDDLLVAELAHADEGVAMAAAGALVERGDRRGLRTALERAANPHASDLGVIGALEALGRARAPQLPELAFRLVIDRPGCDGALHSALVDLPPSPERSLVLARIAARPLELPPVDPSAEEDPPARLAVEMLEPIPAGGRVAVTSEDRPRVVVSALAQALRKRADPVALEHAAVTCCALGPEALAALCDAVGLDLRPVLLAALTHGDATRRTAARAAIARLDVPGLRWLTHDAAVVPIEVRAALIDHSLRVVRVEIDPLAPGGLVAAVESWRGEPLDLDRVADVLETWEVDGMDAIELAITRPATGGVRVSVTFPLAGPDAPGWLLRVVAGGAGVAHEAATNDRLRPSCRSTHALASVQSALVLHPDVSTRIVIRAER